MKSAGMHTLPTKEIEVARNHGQVIHCTPAEARVLLNRCSQSSETKLIGECLEMPIGMAEKSPSATYLMLRIEQPHAA